MGVDLDELSRRPPPRPCTALQLSPQSLRDREATEASRAQPVSPAPRDWVAAAIDVYKSLWVTGPFRILRPQTTRINLTKTRATSIPSMYGTCSYYDYDLLTEMAVDKGDSIRSLLNQFVRDVLVIDNPSTTHKHRLHLYSENPSIKMISFAPASNSLVTCPVPNILPVAQRRVHVLNRLIQLRQRRMSAPLGYPPLTMRFLKLAESTSLSWTFRLWKNPMTAIQKNPSRASRMNSTSPSQKNPTRASQKNPTRESQSAWIPCNALRVAMLAHPPASSG